MAPTTLRVFLLSGPGSELAVVRQDPRQACNAIYHRLYNSGIEVIRMNQTTLAHQGRRIRFVAPDGQLHGFALVDASPAGIGDP